MFPPILGIAPLRGTRQQECFCDSERAYAGCSGRGVARGGVTETSPLKGKPNHSPCGRQGRLRDGPEKTQLQSTGGVVPCDRSAVARNSARESLGKDVTLMQQLHSI